jgi:hypothetical protein
MRDSRPPAAARSADSSRFARGEAARVATEPVAVPATAAGAAATTMVNTEPITNAVGIRE